MAWNLQSDRPIYAQLVDQIQRMIVTGIFPAGSRLPSVRELAAEAAVNPNTMQKALSELERSGLVYSHRTSGRFITDDQPLIRKMREELAGECIRQFLAQMQDLGFEDNETVEMLEKTLKGGKQ